ncbi:MAG: hypothetical protein VW437_00965 [Betaproteobacteria bacterium]
MYLFQNLTSYDDYLNKYELHNKLGFERDESIEFMTTDVAIRNDLNESVPKSPVYGDLIRLHHLILSRKVTTVLEFGVGMSTVVFNDALKINEKKHGDYVKSHLRNENPFRCYSIDTSEKWINETRERYQTSNVVYHLTNNTMQTFNGRICSLYDNLPNIFPDLIYIDGPCRYYVEGDVRGISSNSASGLPMSADVLAMEHFLAPGTLIVVDGRGANARFIHANLQRRWLYSYVAEYDQHFFELVEEPLGKLNKIQLDYCLGADFYDRVSTS